MPLREILASEGLSKKGLLSADELRRAADDFIQELLDLGVSKDDARVLSRPVMSAWPRKAKEIIKYSIDKPLQREVWRVCSKWLKKFEG